MNGRKKLGYTHLCFLKGKEIREKALSEINKHLCFAKYCLRLELKNPKADIYKSLIKRTQDNGLKNRLGEAPPEKGQGLDCKLTGIHGGQGITVLFLWHRCWDLQIKVTKEYAKRGMNGAKEFINQYLARDTIIIGIYEKKNKLFYSSPFLLREVLKKVRFSFLEKHNRIGVRVNHKQFKYTEIGTKDIFGKTLGDRIFELYDKYGK